MSPELRKEWNSRAKRPGLQSVMSLRWSEAVSVVATGALKERIYGALGDIQGKNLLEIGSGIGRFTGDFRSAGANVLAVDYSIEMIKRAQADVNGVQFINASATELPLLARTFDTSVAVTVLQHIVDPIEFQRALGEIKRVTNNRILICDELRDNRPEKVSPFTVLRTFGQFSQNMDGWSLERNENLTCITDQYRLMVWVKNGAAPTQNTWGEPTLTDEAIINSQDK